MKLIKSLDLLNEVLAAKIADRAAEEKMLANHILHSNIKSIEKISSKITAWSLTVIGGTFLAILSDEYVHPEDKTFKYGYFIFVIGWACIGRAIYLGLNLSQHSSASERNINNRASLEATFLKIQDCFSKQLFWFKWGLAAFFIW